MISTTENKAICHKLQRSYVTKLLPRENIQITVDHTVLIIPNKHCKPVYPSPSVLEGKKNPTVQYLRVEKQASPKNRKGKHSR